VKRLLTIGHSYVVAANRALAHHLAREGQSEWSVTAVAPARLRGDLRPITIEPLPGEAATLAVVPVRFDRAPHLMWYGGEMRRLLQQDWDIVHCWEEPYVLAGAQIARATRRPARLVVATFQNIDKRYPWPLARFERETMSRASGWVAFGETVRRALCERPGYRDIPGTVIPAGVDVERFRPDAAAGERVREGLGWASDALVVGFLGRFVEQKGLRVLMRALRDVRAPWHALFVGGGPLEPELRAFAAEHSGRVHVATSVPHDEVAGWLNAMTLLCAPSQATASWREQFGRMLIEAMASGVPVVASDSGEIPHVVGKAGTIVGEHDTAGWAAAIDRLAGDHALRRRNISEGLSRVASQFAWPVVARAHLAFFAGIAGGGAG
jgi:glycosyltransferase involved in cell wall biosynthesis